MSNLLKNFTAIEGLSNVWSAQKGTLRCTVLRLKNDKLCLYSPVSNFPKNAIQSLKELGEITHIIAPNHYHNKGLVEYAARFPNCTILCSNEAKPRLEKQTGLKFQNINEIETLLLSSFKTLEPKGLKTGEIWIEVIENTKRAWIIADAFKGPVGPPELICDQIELLGTFPKFGIADKKGYTNWLSQRIATSPANIIIPCHGSIAEGSTIASIGLELVRNLK